MHSSMVLSNFQTKSKKNHFNSSSLSLSQPLLTDENFNNPEAYDHSLSSKLVIAKHNFQPLDPRTDLRLEKGKKYIILSKTVEGSPGWWKARNNRGQIGLIPSNYVQEVSKSSLYDYSWFLPELDRETSEKLLKYDSREGAFLVRRSSSQELYTISLLVKDGKHGDVKHYLIRISANKAYYICENQHFSSIQDLINYHRQERGSLASRLKYVPNLIGVCDKSSDQRNLKLKLSTLTDKSWEISANQLCLLEELGSGQFGVVRKGKWMQSIEVAVKLMKEGTMSEQAFIEEAKVMTKLQHPNLVQLYGLCIEHRPICIVTEYMKYGSLLSYLRKNEENLKHKPTLLLDMCIQVCSGMAYLEAHNYIHRDLAARNCLVGESHVIKVADFGLTRYVNDDEYTSSGDTKFPIKWAPPEVLWFTRFSSKSDVWACGVLMWEVFTCGKMPYGRVSNAQVVEQIREGKRLEKPKICPNEVYFLMKLCWKELPENRPSFSQLNINLKSLLHLIDFTKGT